MRGDQAGHDPKIVGAAHGRAHDVLGGQWPARGGARQDGEPRGVDRQAKQVGNRRIRGVSVNEEGGRVRGEGGRDTGSSELSVGGGI